MLYVHIFKSLSKQYQHHFLCIMQCQVEGQSRQVIFAQVQGVPWGIATLSHLAWGTNHRIFATCFVTQLLTCQLCLGTGTSFLRCDVQLIFSPTLLGRRRMVEQTGNHCTGTGMCWLCRGWMNHFTTDTWMISVRHVVTMMSRLILMNTVFFLVLVSFVPMYFSNCQQRPLFVVLLFVGLFVCCCWWCLFVCFFVFCFCLLFVICVLYVASLLLCLLVGCLFVVHWLLLEGKGGRIPHPQP